MDRYLDTLPFPWLRDLIALNPDTIVFGSTIWRSLIDFPLDEKCDLDLVVPGIFVNDKKETQKKVVIEPAYKDRVLAFCESIGEEVIFQDESDKKAYILDNVPIKKRHKAEQMVGWTHHKLIFPGKFSVDLIATDNPNLFVKKLTGFDHDLFYYKTKDWILRLGGNAVSSPEIIENILNRLKKKLINFSERYYNTFPPFRRTIRLLRCGFMWDDPKLNELFINSFGSYPYHRSFANDTPKMDDEMPMLYKNHHYVNERDSSFMIPILDQIYNKMKIDAGAKSHCTDTLDSSSVSLTASSGTTYSNNFKDKILSIIILLKQVPFFEEIFSRYGFQDITKFADDSPHFRNIFMALAKDRTDFDIFCQFVSILLPSIHKYKKYRDIVRYIIATTNKMKYDYLCSLDEKFNVSKSDIVQNFVSDEVNIEILLHNIWFDIPDVLEYIKKYLEPHPSHTESYKTKFSGKTLEKMILRQKIDPEKPSMNVLELAKFYSKHHDPRIQSLIEESKTDTGVSYWALLHKYYVISFFQNNYWYSINGHHEKEIMRDLNLFHKDTMHTFKMTGNVFNAVQLFCEHKYTSVLKWMFHHLKLTDQWTIDSEPNLYSEDYIYTVKNDTIWHYRLVFQKDRYSSTPIFLQHYADGSLSAKFIFGIYVLTKYFEHHGNYGGMISNFFPLFRYVDGVIDFTSDAFMDMLKVELATKHKLPFDVNALIVECM
jgi:hypothetical protein